MKPDFLLPSLYLLHSFFFVVLSLQMALPCRPICRQCTTVLCKVIRAHCPRHLHLRCYFSQLQARRCPFTTGKTLYSLSAAALQNFSLSNSALEAQVVTIGTKPPSDGMSYFNNRHLYFGSLNTNAVMVWDTNKPLSSQQVLVQQAEDIQWPDTFAYSPTHKSLLFTTNRLQLFFSGTMNFSDVNFRIISVPVDGQSYLTGERPYRSQEACSPLSTGEPDTGLTYGEAVGVAFGCLLVGLVIGFLIRHYSQHQGWVTQPNLPAPACPLYGTSLQEPLL